jgi:hypothetical protein
MVRFNHTLAIATNINQIMRVSRCLSSALMLLVVQSVLAEAWVDVGDGWYVDRNSRKRNGDVATVLVRHVSKMHVVDEVTFDCKNGIATNWSWKQPLPTRERPSLLRAQELACRQSWEFWK